jgi:hypothetical protein
MGMVDLGFPVYIFNSDVIQAGPADEEGPPCPQWESASL